MTDLRTAAQQALEAMESAEVDPHSSDAVYKAIIALRAALAETVEPVAWSFEARHIDTAFGPAVSIRHPGREHKYMRNVKPLYLAPPQRKPLTEEEIRDLLEAEFLGRDGKRSWDDDLQVFRLAERAHGIT